MLLALDAAIASLRAEAPELGWTSAPSRHLTLKFLGEVAADRRVALTHALDDVARARMAFTIHLSQVGAFPSFQRARVLWLGVGPEPRLELLQHDLELRMLELGFELEGRAFRPHITLARVRDVPERERMRRLARVARKVDFSDSAEVAELVLFESMLATAGARYRRIHAATFGGR